MHFRRKRGGGGSVLERSGVPSWRNLVTHGRSGQGRGEKAMHANITPGLELEVRRTHSSKLDEMKALRLWLDDTFGQIALHDDRIYRYKVRIKTIESVLLKIDGKVADEKARMSLGELDPAKAEWSNANTFDDFEDLIDDWVGCRVITYVISDLQRLHLQIRAHPRLMPMLLTVHDSIDWPVFVGANKIRPKTGCEAESRLNHNGYVGVHYVIAPKAIDPCWNTRPEIFRKFELQIRSLIQETWGQVQHGAIYKGRIPEALKREKSDSLASLSQILTACDQALSKYVDTKAGTDHLLPGMTQRRG
jgi:ppGpp synthetase/RelA/SpoT-type nucleotidyltranferase